MPTHTHTLKARSQAGIWIGLAVIALWTGLLAFNLSRPVDYASPLTYLLLLVQAHLFTGLFITAHDAMHGAVAPGRPRLNHAIGRLCTFLFIFNSYRILKPKHYLHHRFAGTEKDPDYHKGHPGFWRWYFDFLREYVTWKQILAAAITFNVAGIWIPKENMVLFWIIPSFLATFQLFYFGTYRPHMGEHDNAHNSSTLPQNHLWAFLSCYFFGYHYEHHDSPMTPWWLLWRVKEAQPEARTAS